MTTETTLTALRAVALFGPVAGMFLALRLGRPSRRDKVGAFLAACWCVPAVSAVHWVAVQAGWWRFHVEGGTLLGMPVDALIGWALLWGAIPALAFPRLPLPWLVAAAILFDLATMPALAPMLELGPDWLLGEALAVGIVLVPARLLSRWTAQDRRLRSRVGLLVVLFAALHLWLLPQLVFEQVGGSWDALGPNCTRAHGLLGQLVAIPALFALCAVQEFAVIGRGTPVPFDPPRKLVTSGPYAYVANPMQLGTAVLLIGFGALLESPWVMTMSLMSVVFSAGLAAWDERTDLGSRFGSTWVEYRRSVRNWWPRWRPHLSVTAQVYYADGCGVCVSAVRLLRRLRPRGLEFVPASRYPGPPLVRITYVREGDEDSGVAAVARVLEHVHLGWAFLGFLIRLPGVVHGLQLILDLVVGSPGAPASRQGPLAPDEPGGDAAPANAPLLEPGSHPYEQAGQETSESPPRQDGQDPPAARGGQGAGRRSR